MIDLNLYPAGKNHHPLRGILIPGAAPLHWLGEIRRMGLSLEDIAAYPVSGLTPNSIWGCLVEWEPEKHLPDFGRNTPCQLAHELVFLPEKTDLFPGVSAEELHQVLLGKKHLFHPELGMVELPAPMPWEEQIEAPAEQPVFVRRPEPPVFIPRRVKTFQIIAPSLSEVLMQLGEDPFPERRRQSDLPLDAFDEEKLALIRALLVSQPPGSSVVPPWMHGMRAYFEDLLRRNKAHIDRLMDMLRSDPEEGLKYAIPIDTRGAGRGSMPAEISLFRRWFQFSLLEAPQPGGGAGGRMVVDQNDLARLREQYLEIAKEWMRKKDFQKATFIYLKLLKEYHTAANALEEAERYTEAIAIYLQYLKNKEKAAECYEKANMAREAIELYKELDHFEKAGDLYRSIGQEEEAKEHYEMAVNRHKRKGEYRMAAHILKDKLNRLEEAQGLLFRGWEEDQDGTSCLKTYFSNIEDDEAFLKKMRTIYADHAGENNWASFLQALSFEAIRRPEVGDAVREIAHEIIAEKRSIAPWVLYELLHLQTGDPLVVRDLMRYKANQKH